MRRLYDSYIEFMLKHMPVDCKNMSQEEYETHRIGLLIPVITIGMSLAALVVGMLIR